MLAKNLFIRVLLIAALGGGSATQALANGEQSVAVDSRAELIRSEQGKIRQEVIAKTGRYRDMDQPMRDRLLREQDKVLALLEGKASSKELTGPDQLVLFNSLEQISAIVNKAEDERMICERTRRVGSHRTENICKTVAQRRAERESAHDSIGRRDSRCLTVGCGSGDTTRPEGW